jgi:succinate dehydrogenase / fumarate reductase cytochrome b subunit
MTGQSASRGLIASSVAKKFVSGITGLALVGFVIVHLLGNLTLFAGAEAMNTYAHLLHTAGGGMVVYVFEAILLVFFLGHIVSGVQVWLSKRRARPVSMQYKVTGDAGATSRKTNSSLTMVYTGFLILAFTIFHLISFKFGPAEPQGYIAVHNGVEMRDIYRLVVEKFKNEYYTVGYVVMMGLLGWHLRHGIWSSFQSLGLSSAKAQPIVSVLAWLLAIALAVGFIFLPIYVYLFAVPG